MVTKCLRSLTSNASNKCKEHHQRHGVREIVHFNAFETQLQNFRAKCINHFLYAIEGDRSGENDQAVDWIEKPEIETIV